MGFLDDAIREHLELKRRRGADPADVERAEREALGPVRRHPEPLEGEAFGDEPLGALSSPDAEHEPQPPIFQGEQGPLAEHPPAEYEHLDPSETGHFSDEHRLPEAEAAGPEHLPTEHLSPDTGPIERYYRPPVEREVHEAPGPVLDDPYEPEREIEHAPAPEAARPLEPELEPELGPIPGPTPHAAPAGPPTEEHPPPHLSQPTQEYEVRFDHEDSEEHAPEPETEQEHDEDDVLEETPEFLQDTPDHDRLWFEQRPPRDFDFDG
jgi:hypothetical protein